MKRSAAQGADGDNSGASDDGSASEQPMLKRPAGRTVAKRPEAEGADSDSNAGDLSSEAEPAQQRRGATRKRPAAAAASEVDTEDNEEQQEARSRRVTSSRSKRFEPRGGSGEPLDQYPHVHSARRRARRCAGCGRPVERSIRSSGEVQERFRRGSGADQERPRSESGGGQERTRS